MADIATRWSTEDGRGDWALVGPDLAADLEIQTAVILSLFSDRVAGPDDVIPDGTADPQGWWADDAEHPLGSRLWLLDRAKQTDQVLQDARVYAQEALAWLVADGVAASTISEASWVRAGMLGLVVTIFKPDGSSAVFRFESAWLGTV
jgi:phage gp46-like protein